MTYGITAYDYKQALDERNLVTLTFDEALDIVENYENNLIAKQKTSALAYAKDSNIDNNIEYIRSKNALKSLNDFWNDINNSTVNEFYIDKSKYERIKKEQDIIKAYFSFEESLYHIANVIDRECNIEYTVEHGAVVKTKTTPTKADDVYYVSFKLTKGADTHYRDICLCYENAKIDAEILNKENRFFKCKSCGTVACIKKSDDEKKIAQGLKPVQRCHDCIEKRKINKKAFETMFGTNA